MYPVPLITDLSFFSGRAQSSYTGFATAALAQAAIVFTFKTEITDPSQFAGYNNITAADAQSLATTGICALADYIYLRMPYQQVIASPMQDESIGSYHYSKPIQEMARNAAALEVTGESLGIPMFDLAVQLLSKRTIAGGVYSAAVRVFDLKADDSADYKAQLRVVTDPCTGTLYVAGPGEMNQIDFPGFVDINSEVFPVSP